MIAEIKGKDKNMNKVVEETNKLIDAIKEQLEKLHEQYDEADSKNPHEQTQIMNKIDKLTEEVERLERFKESMKAKHVAVDPKTGLVLREATKEEAAQYDAQPGKALFRKPVLVGSVLIDYDCGKPANRPFSSGVN